MFVRALYIRLAKNRLLKRFLLAEACEQRIVSCQRIPCNSSHIVLLAQSSALRVGLIGCCQEIVSKNIVLMAGFSEIFLLLLAISVSRSPVFGKYLG